MADPVQLTDLDVITRYSIAVRQASAERSELIAVMRADLAWLEGAVVAAAPQRTVRKTAAKAVVKKADKRAPTKAARKRTVRGTS